MSEAMVDQVRRFNRTVTARVGAVNDRFLGRERPLGAARLLWEIGLGGCEVRLLRSRMELDSGYLSRLLRSLESAGLIELTPSASDRRIRVARLTAAGRVERAALDERADVSRLGRGPRVQRRAIRRPLVREAARLDEVKSSEHMPTAVA